MPEPDATYGTFAPEPELQSEQQQQQLELEQQRRLEWELELEQLSSALERERERELHVERRCVGRWWLLLGCVLALVGLLVAVRALRDPAARLPALPEDEGGDERSSAARVQSIKVFAGSSRAVRVEIQDLDGQGEAEDERGADAWAVFNDSLHLTGWSQLWVHTQELLPEQAEDQQRRSELMFAAGYAEGALTHRRIDQHFANVLASLFPNAVKGDAGELQVLRSVRRFLEENLGWLRAQIEGPRKRDDAGEEDFWRAVEVHMAQFDGLVEGYRAFSENLTPISEIDMFMLNAGGDMEDLISVVSARQGVELSPVTASLYTFIKNLKCSALIRILPGFQDLVWGHATWDTYSAMNRIFKHLDLPAFHATSGSQRWKTSMSSFPGYLSSTDDWYMSSSGLAVMETTNGVFEPSLYSYVTTSTVLCWLRAKAANYVATDSQGWVDVFSKHNSGTYNNQWMVIDTKRFVVGEGFQPYGFVVLEQLPGFIHSEDMSAVVNRKGFWASYNVPFFPSVYTQSGYLAAFQASNDSESWSYTDCSRARIFERDAPRVATLGDLRRLLRYNDWERDPLSGGHASHAVAARFDLETDAALVSLDGAVDAKATSLALFARLECDAVSGPTDAQAPPFAWTAAARALAPHAGLPPRYAFAFERMRHSR